MSTLTWVGGGNNDANNAQDWSPAQTPASGDTLVMPDGGTMNVTNNDLAGNTLQVGTVGTSSATTTSDLNLSGSANVSINQPLVLNGGNFVTNIDSTGGNTLTMDAPTGSAPLNVRDFNVDITSGSLRGSLATDYSTVSISGDGNLNNVDSTFAATSAVINTDVVGSGSIDVTALPTFGGIVAPGSLELGGKVGGGETVAVGHTTQSVALQWDTVKIDDPKDFHGSVVMQPRAEVDLVGLSKADSYLIQNDQLQFISGNHVIDTLKLTNDSSANLVVSTNGIDAYVTQQGLSNPPAGSTTLPQASMAMADLNSNVTSAPAQSGIITPDGSSSTSSAMSPTANPIHVMPPTS